LVKLDTNRKPQLQTAVGKTEYKRRNLFVVEEEFAYTNTNSETEMPFERNTEITATYNVITNSLCIIEPAMIRESIFCYKKWRTAVLLG
jgi:hypothetical protein